MTPMEYIQLRAFARQDGALTGAVWIASFACFILNFARPAMGMAAMLLAVASLVLVAKRLQRFRDDVLGGRISFLRATAFVILVFFYAGLLLSVVQWAYFEWLDNGYVASRYAAMMSSAEMTEVLRQHGMEQQMRDGMELFRQMRPIDFALNSLTVNISLGIIYAIPLALVLKKDK